MHFTTYFILVCLVSFVHCAPRLQKREADNAETSPEPEVKTEPTSEPDDKTEPTPDKQHPTEGSGPPFIPDVNIWVDKFKQIYSSGGPDKWINPTYWIPFGNKD